MFFWIPPQRLWRWFTVNPAWAEMQARHAKYLAKKAADEAEEARRQAEIEAREAARWAEIEEEAEHMCEMLPLYLHNIGLSYKRTLQDRKDGGHYERIEYCKILDWEVTEDTYYFWIGTFYPDPLPAGVHIAHFRDERVSETLSANFGSRTWVHYNNNDGLWICVERRAGRGQVPKHVTYQQSMAAMPKAADPLSFPVGQGVNRREYIVDLSEVTNLLIGGSQGGGKSNQVNVMLSTFIRRNRPEDLRLFLADFKRVEFAFYRGLPHLGGDTPWVAKSTDKGVTVSRTVAPDYRKDGVTLEEPLGQKIITEAAPLVTVVEYLLAEIERRTNLMSGKVKKISTWNKRYPKRKLSRWVLVVDELADVMLRPDLKSRLEEPLIRVIQLGRACGIHVILATQTPSSKVITTLIQNNIVSRVAFRCGTGIASGTMLDGKYEAAQLPPIPGRAIFRSGGQMFEVQTPEISDLSLREVVHAAKSGDHAPAPERKVAPDVVFAYALDQLGGDCSYRDLYNHFRHQDVSQKDIQQILQDYQVAGTPPALEPEIEIDDEIYYLAPAVTGSRKGRQLVKARQFEDEFEAKWADLLTLHGSRVTENGQTVVNDDEKNTETELIEEVI